MKVIQVGRPIAGWATLVMLAIAGFALQPGTVTAIPPVVAHDVLLDPPCTDSQSLHPGAETDGAKNTVNCETYPEFELGTTSESELAAHAHILTDCYEAAVDIDAKEACIGKMSAACMESENHTRVGVTACLSLETEAWTGFLNNEFLETQRTAKARDEEDAVDYPQGAVRVEKLQEAQRAWIVFRDAECALEFAAWGDGSMRYIADQQCHMKMAAQRTLDLLRKRETFCHQRC